MVAPTGRCWVQVSADGQMRVAREVAAGERLTIDAAERLQIVVGDAGKLAYELNGRPGKPLGAAGRVARATIVPSTVSQFQASVDPCTSASRRPSSTCSSTGDVPRDVRLLAARGLATPTAATGWRCWP